MKLSWVSMSLLWAFCSLDSGVLPAADWPMRGKDATRNAVSLEKNAPLKWQIPIEKKEPWNIHWVARLGTFSLADPVIEKGLVWAGTNNDPPRDPKQKRDASVLMCFRERDGKFLYQHLSPRLAEGKRFDWEQTGLASSPLVQGQRLWFCNNRYEVICLDIGPLLSQQKEPNVVWKFDLRKELGVAPCGVMIPNNAIHCSIAGHQDLIYVNTGNARYSDKVPAPQAPSLVCLHKETGKVVWKDNSPGGEIIEIQHGSPLVTRVDGGVQVIMGQGDGWLRSFEALTGELLWKFDINFKKPDRSISQADHNYFLASPVLYSNRIYIASGRHAEHGEGPGRLCCIHPTKRGDVSSELGNGDGKPNPNSALVWQYLGAGAEIMHRTMSSVAIHHNLVIAPDRKGIVHCLNAQTGHRFWAHDMRAAIYGSPLIADNKVYIGDEDGDLVILELSQKKKLLAEHNFPEPIYASPVYANELLYVMTSGHLYAIKDLKAERTPD